MQHTVNSLRARMQSADVDFASGEVFDLLAAAACFLCCRDGARGGNKDCAPATELEQDS